MAKDIASSKLPKGASRAQVRDYLFQLFSQGQPPTSALDRLKSARDIGETARALRAGPERVVKLPDGIRRRPDED